MLKIRNIILTLTFILLITACGGGSTSGSSEQDDTVMATVNPSMATTNAVVETNVTTDTVTLSLSTDVTEEPLLQLPTTSSSSSAPSTNQTENNIQTSQAIVNAGADRNTTVNQTITLTGTVSNVGTESLSYKWTKGSTVLATTASFDYTPKDEDALPTAGHRVDVLTFSVITNNGDSSSDSVNITVLP